MTTLREDTNPGRLAGLALLATTALTACGGNGGGGDRADDDPRLQGTLVIPDTGEVSQVAARMLDTDHWMAKTSEDCPDVPAGYRPLAAAEITFLDGANAALGETLTTDDCGAFNTAPPAGAVRLRALADGYRDVVADADTFRVGGEGGGLASTIPDTASYRIGSLQLLDEARVGFTVTDTDSGQTVLGIPASAFAVRADGAELSLSSIATAASSSGAASVSLVLDASGSMSSTAFRDEATDERFSRSQLATRAAHVFLDQKAAADEASVTPFGSEVQPVDQAFIDAEFELQTLDGAPTTYPLGESGFTAESPRLRFVVDAYNRESDLYGRGDPRHPDTPADLAIESRYPFSGSTALFDAIATGIDRVVARGNGRRFVLAMTDGQDNASSLDLEEAVAKAVAANVPIYTVGFGDSVNVDVLDDIAARTGASYFQVEDTDIGNAFQSIQSGIVFQYVALAENVDLREVLQLSVELDFNGLQTARDVTL